MRHLNRNAKLGRKGSHRNAMLANLVCSLIKHKKVVTTVSKAKAARPVAEKMVTLGKKNTLHARRLAAARLRQQARTLHRSKEERITWRQNEDVVRILFEDVAPGFKERNGGYTRIVKISQRRGDAAQKAILEWVESGELAETSSSKSEANAISAAAAAPKVTQEQSASKNEDGSQEEVAKDEQPPVDQKADDASQEKDPEVESENKKDDKS